MKQWLGKRISRELFLQRLPLYLSSTHTYNLSDLPNRPYISLSLFPVNRCTLYISISHPLIHTIYLTYLIYPTSLSFFSTNRYTLYVSISHLFVHSIYLTYLIFPTSLSFFSTKRYTLYVSISHLFVHSIYLTYLIHAISTHPHTHVLHA